MNKIAVLLTCHNRKEKTLSCLKFLYKAQRHKDNQLEMIIYLTDDGSTDGTQEAVKELYPDINILIGNGNLYWAGGMNYSWKEALKSDYDGFLWLNDDSYMKEDYFVKLLKADKYCKEKFRSGGIYIGSTCDSSEKKLTYGGLVYTNKFLNITKTLIPNETYQLAEIGNGNITFVSKDVVKKNGVFHKGFTHGADFDYIFYAYNKKMPVLVIPGFAGVCDNDHIDKYNQFVKLSISERLKFLYSPLGFQFSGSLLFQKRFFPYRVPFVFVGGMIKVFWPNLYLKINKIRKK